MNASVYRRRNKRAAEPKTPTPANTRTAYFGSAAPCVFARHRQPMPSKAIVKEIKKDLAAATSQEATHEE